MPRSSIPRPFKVQVSLTREEYERLEQVCEKKGTYKAHQSRNMVLQEIRLELDQLRMN